MRGRCICPSLSKYAILVNTRLPVLNHTAYARHNANVYNLLNFITISQYYANMDPELDSSSLTLPLAPSMILSRSSAGRTKDTG